LLFGAPVQLIEDGVEPVAALLFEICGIACSEAAEMGDDFLLRGEAIFAERAAHERLQDLLSPAPADAEHKLERGAIDERVRQVFELPDDFVEAVVPERFVRQGASCNVTKG
jgi:hypothetical protein